MIFNPQTFLTFSFVLLSRLNIGEITILFYTFTAGVCLRLMIGTLYCTRIAHMSVTATATPCLPDWEAMSLRRKASETERMYISKCHRSQKYPRDFWGFSSCSGILHRGGSVLSCAPHAVLNCRQRTELKTNLTVRLSVIHQFNWSWSKGWGTKEGWGGEGKHRGGQKLRKKKEKEERSGMAAWEIGDKRVYRISSEDKSHPSLQI